MTIDLSHEIGDSSVDCQNDIAIVIEVAGTPGFESASALNVRLGSWNAPRRTSADHSEFMGSRPGASPALFPPQAVFALRKRLLRGETMAGHTSMWLKFKSSENDALQKIRAGNG
jgi:hypothetical protein